MSDGTPPPDSPPERWTYDPKAHRITVLLAPTGHRQVIATKVDADLGPRIAGLPDLERQNAEMEAALRRVLVNGGSLRKCKVATCGCLWCDVGRTLARIDAVRKEASDA